MSTRYVGSVRSLKVADLDSDDKEIMPMVLSLASKYYSPEGTITREVLVAAGLHGVAIARSKWKRKQNVRFSSFAFHYIRGQILDTIEAEKKHSERFQATDPADLVDSQKCYSNIEHRLTRDALITRANAIIKRELTELEQTIMRAHLQDESDAEIARRLCLPESSVTATIERTIALLRKRLGITI